MNNKLSKYEFEQLTDTTTNTDGSKYLSAQTHLAKYGQYYAKKETDIINRFTSFYYRLYEIDYEDYIN